MRPPGLLRSQAGRREAVSSAQDSVDPDLDRRAAGALSVLAASKAAMVLGDFDWQVRKQGRDHRQGESVFWPRTPSGKPPEPKFASLT